MYSLFYIFFRIQMMRWKLSIREIEISAYIFEPSFLSPDSVTITSTGFIEIDFFQLLRRGSKALQDRDCIRRSNHQGKYNEIIRYNGRYFTMQIVSSPLKLKRLDIFLTSVWAHWRKSSLLASGNATLAS